MQLLGLNLLSDENLLSGAAHQYRVGVGGLGTVTIQKVHITVN